MVGRNLDISYDEMLYNKIQARNAQILRQKQKFFKDLFEVREERQQIFLKKLHHLVGPAWYHVLSVPQIEALGCLKASIYQDILSGQPTQVARNLKQLGLNSKLSCAELMSCIYFGRNDEKEMFAHMFLLLNKHSYSMKRGSYNYNSKLILSSIFQLGLNDIIKRLIDRFHYDKKKEAEKVESKPKTKKAISPYLEKTYIPIYNPTAPKRASPAPLPDWSALNNLIVEEELAPVSPPKPRPPPIPLKKNYPKSVCDKIAGFVDFSAYATNNTALAETTVKEQGNRSKRQKIKFHAEKSNTGQHKKRPTRPKPPPTFDNLNIQQHITGVFIINNKSVFVLGNVTILPTSGDIIHGGYAYIKNVPYNIHDGIRDKVTAIKLPKCDCHKYYDKVTNFLKSTKCKCGHYYDYGNEGTFPVDELKFFHKPSKTMPYHFDFNNIFQTNPKTNLVEKIFTNLWRTDSILNFGKSGEKQMRDVHGLGDKPGVKDYLKCALILMRRENIAAKLPDLHLAPELVEWMRNRIYGPYTSKQKETITKLSRNYTERYIRHVEKTWHVPLPKLSDYYTKPNTWTETLNFKEKFRQYTKTYKSMLFQVYAKVANSFWAALFANEIPNVKLREIFYSYLFAREDDITLEHPYDSREVRAVYKNKLKKLYRCPLQEK